MNSSAAGILIGFLLLMPLSFATAQSSQGEWVSLFDGETLGGWTVKSGFAAYTVEDGCIVGTSRKGSPNTFLCTDKSYGDFEFEADFKVDPRMNSGIQFRSALRDGQYGGRVNGYQYEIDSSKRSWTAGVFDEGRRGWLANLKTNEKARSAFKKGEWNHCRIVARGNLLKTFINGASAANHRDSMTLSGFFALQVHGTRSKIPLTARWKNLRIKEHGKAAWHALPVSTAGKNWVASGGGQWTVTDGVIRGSHEASDSTQGYLHSTKGRGDFVIRFQVRPITGNSGFFFHSELVRGGTRLKGLQVEIDAAKGIGDLYHALGSKWVSRQDPRSCLRNLKLGEWNSVVVSSVGTRVTVHVNDKMTVDVTKVPGPTDGLFGLQLHGGEDVQIEFRSFERLI